MIADPVAVKFKKNNQTNENSIFCLKLNVPNQLINIKPQCPFLISTYYDVPDALPGAVSLYFNSGTHYRYNNAVYCLLGLFIPRQVIGYDFATTELMIILL